MSHNNIYRATVLMIVLITASGCGLCKKYKRGMILRGDWAVELNRTPWVGCPSDVGCNGKTSCAPDAGDDADSDDDSSPHKKLMSLFRRGDAKGETEKRHGFRIACGKRRGCRPQSPCRLSPICGTFFDMDKPNPVILAMMRNGQIPIPMDVPGVMELVVGTGPNGSPAMSGGQGGQRTSIPAMMAIGGFPNGGMPSGGFVNVNGGVAGSANSGFLAQQILATPGTVLPPGGQLPAGGMVIAGGMVMRPCGMVPQCTAATPCRTHPQCGVLVPATMAQVNAMQLATMQAALFGGNSGGGLYPQLVAGGVGVGGVAMGGGTVYGTGGTVNPITGQIVQSGNVTGMMQAGYPPADYPAQSYYRGVSQTESADDVTGEVAQSDEKSDNPDRVPMPSPRFHSVPTRPTFQRAQGMAGSAPAAHDNTSASASAAAMQRAYIKGMYAAMQQQQTTSPPIGTGFLNGLAAAPANIWGFITDTKPAAVPRSDQQLQAQQMLVYQQQQQLAAMQSAASSNVAEDAPTTQNDIATVSHTEEPPTPPKKSAPMPKLIQQVSYLDVQ